MRVVNVKGMPANAPGIIYCGRACGGWPRSPLANPFKLRPGEDRAGAIQSFRGYLRGLVAAGDTEIIAALLSLPADAVLGCWCAPLSCHCEVIIEVATELRASRG